MTITGSGSEANACLGEVLFEARDVNKFFPRVRALEGVGFTLCTGGVHAFVGENGAGKSTLMKVLSGLYQPDEGEALVRGEPITLSTPFVAQQVGINVIHRESFLMSHLTAAQNMFTGYEPRLPGGPLNHEKLSSDATELLERFGIKIDPCIQVGRLATASQQLLKIAKALSFNSKALIMDKSTTALNGAEVETLFQIMGGFVGPDTGIVYISHHMKEIRRKSTRITVPCGGEPVDSRPSSEATIPEIAQLAAGRKLASDARPEPHESIEMVLDAKEPSTVELLKDVNPCLKKGEILGFVGLMGAGRTEVAQALIGADPRTGGVVTVGGKQVDIHSPKDAVKIGIGYLSEDRKRYGLVSRQDVAVDAVLPSLKKFSTGGSLQDGRMRKAAGRWVKALTTKTPSMRQQAWSLPGSDQQKIMFAKRLGRDYDILIFDEPTHGIDVDAKQGIYSLFDELTDQGKLTIMISSEMEEVLCISNRIAVMCNDRITGLPPNTETTQEKITELATQFTTTETTSEVS